MADADEPGAAGAYAFSPEVRTLVLSGRLTWGRFVIGESNLWPWGQAEHLGSREGCCGVSGCGVQRWGMNLT